MPKIVLIFLAFIVISCQAQTGNEYPVGAIKNAAASEKAFQADFPKPIGYVNDYAQLLSVADRDYLAAKLFAFDSATTNQIAIVIIDSDTLTTGNFDAYSLALSNSWGIGVKGKNNGLAIVLSPELRKIRINTGTGTHKIITDEMCGVVIRDLIVPEFKQEHYFEGLNKATDELIRLWQE